MIRIFAVRLTLAKVKLEPRKPGLGEFDFSRGRNFLHIDVRGHSRSSRIERERDGKIARVSNSAAREARTHRGEAASEHRTFSVPAERNYSPRVVSARPSFSPAPPYRSPPFSQTPPTSSLLPRLSLRVHPLMTVLAQLPRRPGEGGEEVIRYFGG